MTASGVALTVERWATVDVISHIGPQLVELATHGSEIQGAAVKMLAASLQSTQACAWLDSFGGCKELLERWLLLCLQV